MAKVEQNITHTAIGGETSVTKTLTPAWPDTSYVVLASCNKVASIVGIGITSKAVGSFTADFSAPLTAGDVLQFCVYDPNRFTQFVISAASFAPDTASGSGATLVDGQWNFAAGTATIMASLPLPVGTTLTNLTLYYTRGSPGSGAINFSVVKKDGTSAQTTIASALDNTTSGYTSKSLSIPANTVIADAQEYYIRASASAGVNHILFAEVGYNAAIKGT